MATKQALAAQTAANQVVIPTKKQLRDFDAIRPGIERWLRDRLNDSALDVREVHLPGSGAGVANETLLVEAVKDGTDIAFVVRVGASDHLFMGMDVATHFRMYTLLEGEPDIPSPPLIGFEASPDLFGHPFFVMGRVEGRVPPDNPNFYQTGWVTELDEIDRHRLWRNSVEAMSKLHRIDPAKLRFLDRPHYGATGIEQELNYWLHYARWCGGDSYPAVRKASEWLTRYLPTDAPPGLSWGDSRPPNIIFDGVTPAAILDWDMVSLAGAECDLGWWTLMDQGYTIGRGIPRPSGLGTPRQTLTLWEEMVGRRAEYIDWHLVLNQLKSRLVMVRLPAMLEASGQITADQAKALSDRGEMEWLGDLLDRPLVGRFDSAWEGWDR